VLSKADESNIKPNRVVEMQGADEAKKWRALIVPTANRLMGELWECYTSGCQYRGEQVMPYVDFMRTVSHVNHPEIPEYWEIHVADAMRKQVSPEPFIAFANRMQELLGAPSAPAQQRWR
jgi:hypothetical protein